MEETQRHGEELSVPPARHRAPSVQHAMNGDEMQQAARWRFREERVIGFLASIICLAGAIYYLWATCDVRMFLVLIGVATGQIGIWEVTGRARQRRRENDPQFIGGREEIEE